jgi:glyoxylase-like metal-dependent hydrolase (beta-lactamase superfamily II)/Flp pilus assembly protein TadD
MKFKIMYMRRAGAALGAMLTLLSSGLSGQDQAFPDDVMKAFQAANAHFARGVGDFERNETEKALAALEESVRTLPRHAFARYYIANILYIRKDYAGALAQMEASLADYDAMVGLFEQADRMKLDNMDGLLHSLQGVADESGSCRDRRSVEFFGSQVVDKGKAVQDAAKRRRQAQERMKAHYAYFCGNILFQLKRLADAAARYEDALRIDPGHANAYNNLAAIYFLAKLYPNAVQVLDRAEANGVEDQLNLKLKEAAYAAEGRPVAGILQEDLPPARPGGPAIARFALAVRPAGSALPPLYENAYLVFDPASRDAVLIDAGAADERIREFAALRSLSVKAVLNTHGHSDHTGGNRHFAEMFKAPVFAPEAGAAEAAAKPDRLIRAGETLECGSLRIEVLATPGHTPGSVCFRIGDELFTGDTLFRNDIGKIGTDDEKERVKMRKAMIQAVRDRLLVLPDEARILPGHGRTTRVGDEKANNPYFK